MKRRGSRLHPVRVPPTISSATWWPDPPNPGLGPGERALVQLGVAPGVLGRGERSTRRSHAVDLAVGPARGRAPERPRGRSPPHPRARAARAPRRNRSRSEVHAANSAGTPNSAAWNGIRPNPFEGRRIDDRRGVREEMAPARLSDRAEVEDPFGEPRARRQVRRLLLGRGPGVDVRTREHELALELAQRERLEQPQREPAVLVCEVGAEAEQIGALRQRDVVRFRSVQGRRGAQPRGGSRCRRPFRAPATARRRRRAGRGRRPRRRRRVRPR